MKLLKASEAARRLGVSYPTLKQWIYRGRIESVRTPGGHHRIPSSEIDRMIGLPPNRSVPGDESAPTISGRNKLEGVIMDVRYEGLFAQILLDVSGQTVTSIITRGAAEEMNLAPGMPAMALIKATQVMILRQHST